MEFSDLDIMLKYKIRLLELEQSYDGDTKKYCNGKSLDIFPSYDLVNKSNPLFVFGTVVYLMYGDNVLMLKPMKDNRVVDSLTGLGGKVRAVLNGKVLSDEKAGIIKILDSYAYGSVDTEESLKNAASREVMEETGTYSLDDNGNFTHDMIREGIRINPLSLQNIGVSRIRMISDKKTECWLIQNYSYSLSDEEYLFIEENIAKENREGLLKWYSIDEVYPFMTLSDQAILRMRDKNSVVSEIRDSVNDNNVFRILIKGESSEIMTLVNRDKVYSNSKKLDGLCNSLLSEDIIRK